MSPVKGFGIGWDAGPSTQVEVYSPNLQTLGAAYRLKFTPPFRSTLRPPERMLALSQKTLNGFRKDLGDLFVAADARGGGPVAAPVNNDVIKKTKNYGGQLFDSIAPPNVQAELNPKDLYLEIGVDEPLIELAWELLHDGTEFLCLKHRVARFVNVAQETSAFTSDQILEQSGVAILAQAEQLPSLALKLLGS